MTSVFPASTKEIIKAFECAGYYFDQQTDSHIILKHANRKTVSIPLHNPAAGGMCGAIRDLISVAGFSVAEFIDLLKR